MYIISIYDLENFLPSSKKLDTAGLFHFLNELQTLVIRSLAEHEPALIKNPGDQINMAFLMLRQPFKGRFTISPPLFRQLLPEPIDYPNQYITGKAGPQRLH